jgi:hypothetical protein
VLPFGRLAVIVCVLVSCALAGRFGWTRGASLLDQSIYAAAAVALDLFKAGLPLLAVAAWQARRTPQAVAGWFAFAWLTGFSLMCASGLTAAQLAEKLSLKTAASTTYESRKAELDRLLQQQAALPRVAPADAAAESAVRAAVAQIDASVKAECEKRGPRCRELEGIARDKHDELARVVAAVAATKAARQLERKIEAAYAALEEVDIKAATRDADPQAGDIAHLTGIGRDTVTALLHLVLAISIEIGSGLGVWLAFGHGRKPEPAELARADGLAVEPLAALASEPVVEGPDDILRRFAEETLRPAPGSRVSASELFAAYERWCEREGIEPLNATLFGRRMGAILGKERKGGRQWYSDVAFAPKLEVAVDNTQRRALGRMAGVR